MSHYLSKVNLMRITLIIMGFLGLFGCKPKAPNNNLAFDLKPVLDSVALQEVFIADLL
ncbi:MAG: hypothetical protein J0L67_19945 [Cytophagales bacterium]|nr:hypothetical protein [Cytophagales bacterium]